MIKNKIEVNNCQHVQLGGMAFYDGGKTFLFSPDGCEPGTTPRFRRYGVAQQMEDGTFDFVASPSRHSKSILIKKLPHGRLSATCDGAVQLTLKVYKDEGIDPYEAIFREAIEAVEKHLPATTARISTRPLINHIN